MNDGPRIIPVGETLPPMDVDRSRPAGGSAGKPKRKLAGKRAGGRFGVLNSFVDETLRRIDNTAAVVWLILYRDTKPDGLARTSQRDMARRAGVSVSTVYRALRRLDHLGLLIVVRKGRLGTGASVYRVLPKTVGVNGP